MLDVDYCVVFDDDVVLDEENDEEFVVIILISFFGIFMYELFFFFYWKYFGRNGVLLRCFKKGVFFLIFYDIMIDDRFLIKLILCEMVCYV